MLLLLLLLRFWFSGRRLCLGLRHSGDAAAAPTPATAAPATAADDVAATAAAVNGVGFCPRW